MEQNQTYVYKKNDRRSVNSVKLLVRLIMAVCIAAALFAGIWAGRDRAKRETELQRTTAAPTTEVTEAVRPADAIYPVGAYRVNSGNYNLLLRDSPSKDSGYSAELSNGTDVLIEEVLYDAGASDPNYLYWGKTTCEGHTGWLPMFYLERKSDLPQNVVEEIPGPSEETEPATEEAPETEPATEITGDYIVSAPDGTIRLRAQPDPNADVAAILADGQRVIVEGSSEGADGALWAQITESGRTGYLPFSSLTRAG